MIRWSVMVRLLRYSINLVTCMSSNSLLLQDLYRWWFKSRCSDNKMSVVARPWLEVVQDSRYKKGEVIRRQ